MKSRAHFLRSLSNNFVRCFSKGLVYLYVRGKTSLELVPAYCVFGRVTYVVNSTAPKSLL